MQFVGPIVGKVTETTARVVLQSDAPGLVTIGLQAFGSSRIEKSAVASADEPVVGIAFDNLAPATVYELSVAVDGKQIAGRTGRVTTRASQAERLQVAAVSCNFTVREGDAQRWQHLLETQIRTGLVSTVLHIGDQVYLDTAFGQSIQDVRSRGRTEEVRREITARFRRVYEYAWNYAPTREVLATASNLMIWDDHELRNGWGSHEQDRNPESNRFWVATIARRIFQDFQRRLWAEPDASVAHEGHAHVHGKLGIVFLDQRGARTFSYDAARPYLGRAQWQWLRETLESVAFAQVTALLIVTSVPLLYVGESAAALGGIVFSDLRDQWSHPDHRGEQADLIFLIRNWKGKSTEKTIAVLGGDVHVGGQTVVEELDGAGEWQRIFDQFITSPITNEPPGPLSFFGLKTLLLNQNEPINERLRYRHEYLTRRRNYAVLELAAPAAGRPSIVGKLWEDERD
ncbi:MAG TPA: alkaline phosphatase D family protein [Polyangiaceae bacterium]|nr:alkaline phosphatase D family protein [Polyangiaceae bacterium]